MVAQLVEALCYKPVGHGFGSCWGQWEATLRTWVDSASNRHDYKIYLLGGKGNQCIGLTTLSPSFVGQEILRTSTFWSSKGLSTPVMEKLYLWLVLCRGFSENKLH
jgi:hypothetical protein